MKRIGVFMAAGVLFGIALTFLLAADDEYTRRGGCQLDRQQVFMAGCLDGGGSPASCERRFWLTREVK